MAIGVGVIAMAPKMKESSARRFENPEMRFVTLKLSQLAFDALNEGEQNGSQHQVEVGIEVAIRFYLRDRDSGQAAWPYPLFLRGSEVREDVEVRLGIDHEL